MTNAAFAGRHFLSLADYTKDEIIYLLELSKTLKREKAEGVFRKPLANKHVALLFEKLSTRTRCALAVAGASLGAHTEFLNLGAPETHWGVKESVKDTARVLGGMFDFLAFRGFRSATLRELADYSGVPVINALTDDDHPTQVLADFLTIYENFGRLGGIKLVFCGDGRSNVANALLTGASITGVDFTVAAPRELFPESALLRRCEGFAAASGGRITLETDILKAVRGANAVYTDVWVSMGEEAEKERRHKLLTPYRVSLDVFSKAAPDAIFLHCLPASVGDEVTEAVFEHERSRVFAEAQNRMFTIKAVLTALNG